MIRRIPFAALLLVLGALFAAACGGDDSEPPATATDLPETTTATAGSATAEAPPGVAELRAAQYPDELTDGYFLGRIEAPLTLTVFEDFQCPFCLRYTLLVEPWLVEKYVKPGKLRIQFQNLVILGDDSAFAALGSQCAAHEDRFWEYHRELFALQVESGQLVDEKLNVGRFSEENLEKLATAAGLDAAAFGTCLRSPENIAAVQEQLRTAAGFGLNSTPSFVINGEPLGYIPRDTKAWGELLDARLAAAGG